MIQIKKIKGRNGYVKKLPVYRYLKKSYIRMLSAKITNLIRKHEITRTSLETLFICIAVPFGRIKLLEFVCNYRNFLFIDTEFASFSLPQPFS